MSIAEAYVNERPNMAEPGGQIRIDSVAHSYFDAESLRNTEVIRGISMCVQPGEFVAYVGPSGCGKTTLLNLIAGLDVPAAGAIEVDGAAPRAGNDAVAYLFSRDAMLPWRTALRNVMLPLELLGVPRREAEDRARVALDAVGLGDFQGRYRAQLSQGMRQRVAIARTMVSDPGLLLLDEPFSALDAHTRLAVQTTFLAARERIAADRGAAPTVILVTHDLEEAILLADRVFVFARRPTWVKAEVAVDIDRPRDLGSLRSHPRVSLLYDKLWHELAEELGGQATPQIRTDG